MTSKPLSKDARYYRDLLSLATMYPHRILFETTTLGVTRAFTTLDYQEWHNPEAVREYDAHMRQRKLLVLLKHCGHE